MGNSKIGKLLVVGRGTTSRVVPCVSRVLPAPRAWMSDDLGPLRTAGERKIFHDRHGNLAGVSHNLLEIVPEQVDHGAMVCWAKIRLVLVLLDDGKPVGPPHRPDVEAACACGVGG